MAKAKGTPIRAFAIFLLAAAIGVLGGLLGSGFQLGLNWIQATLTSQQVEPDGDLEALSTAVKRLAPWHTVLVPTLGGLGAGLLLLLLGRRKPPFGITDIIGLVQLRSGIIRIRDSIVQILSSACTIGTGGSIGREGANSHIAGTVASALGSVFHVGSRARAVLLGCGVAAGMATSYNAPIAGAIFVMEAVLGNFAMDVFAPIVVSSVLATLVRRELLGGQAVYEGVLPGSMDLQPELVLTALALGVFCGIGGILFRHVLKFGRQAFAATRLPKPLQLALGGMIVGVIGIWLPETWGNGIEVINSIASGNSALTLIASLFLWKVVATAATVGSGGLGGIFTPNLVIGAAFGSFFAAGIEALRGTPLAAGQVAFAFAGMAGLTAATMHAPVTAVVLVFELTRHYELTPTVMLCSIVASIVANMLDQDSYYTEALRQKGQTMPHGLEELAIRTTYVRDVMRRDVVTIRDAARFDEVMKLLASHRGDTLYVVDGQNQLTGRIQLQDVKNFLNDPSLCAAVIAADLTRPVVAVHADDSLATALPRFDDPELAELAVVTTGPGSQTQRLLGRLRHQDVIAGISSEVLGQQQRRARFQDADGRKSGLIELPAGWELADLDVPDAWIGHAIDVLPGGDLRELVPLLVVRRTADGASERLAATQDLVLQDGDDVLVLGRIEAIARLRAESGAISE
ncbi:MAG: chloride channel protein [Planctomycetes bacterium]|nr:chloride channel protein [Planctomycetota bacterium]